jgi:hypothetical protein
MRTLYFAGFGMVVYLESSVCESSLHIYSTVKLYEIFFSNNLVNESVFGKRL